AADFYGLAAKEYSRNGNEARELEMLLRKVEVFLGWQQYRYHGRNRS
ncbi:hypothetical protein HT105_25255, partial [Bacteroides fragilis]|nr:hypothetical protein [Bacteroides fragilis]